MKITWKGKFDGNEDSLPHGEHKPNAVKFKEIDDIKKLGLILNLLSVPLLAVTYAIVLLRGGFDAIMEHFYVYWAGILVALLIGIPIGIISAKKQYSLLDNVSMVFALIGVSMPNFWSGLLLVMLFSLTLGWLPSQGMASGFGPMLKSLILPALTLGFNSAAMVARMTRSSMLEVIRQDYISTARAKGDDERTITFQHMLKNALIPIITAVGLQFGNLLGGAMLAETIFSWPGLGRLMVESIKSKDIPMVLGCVIFLATMFTLVNLMVDIIYAFVDPRIKSLYKKGR